MHFPSTKSQKSHKKGDKKFDAKLRKVPPGPPPVIIIARLKKTKKKSEEFDKLNKYSDDAEQETEEYSEYIPFKSKSTRTSFRDQSYDDHTSNDKEREKRKKFIIATSIIVAIVLITFIFLTLLVVLLSNKIHEDDSTRMTIFIPDTNLTALCQNKYNGCYYFKEKFVDNCLEELCHSLKLEPFIPSKPEEQLQFIPNTDDRHPRIKIPDGTLCKIGSGYGFCTNKQCVKDDLITDMDVDAIEPINGGWSDYSYQSSILCVFNDTMNKQQSKLWNILTNRTIAHGCNLCAYKFRTCNNPVPARGGKLCWESTEPYVQWYEWPIRFSRRCLKCLNEFKDQTCNETSKEITCFENTSTNYVLARDNDYCCLPYMMSPSKSHPGPGRCIARTCFPINI